MTQLEMYNIAVEALEAVTEYPAGIPLPQVTAFLAESGKVYCAVNDITGEICAVLDEAGETEVFTMITVWKSGEVDLPSDKLRRALVEWNFNCLETELIMGSAPEFRTVTIRETLM